MLGWLAFVVMVYSYMFYDIHAEQIRLHEKWIRLRDVFTEEE